MCCHPESKLSQTNRKWSKECEVLQFTKEFDLNDVDNQINIASAVNSFESEIIPLIWISLPCTEGTPWTFINMKIPSAQAKVLRHVKEFDGLWISLMSFMNMIKRNVHVALEWPRRCRYWKLTTVSRFLIQYDMTSYHFDGCALGMKDQWDNPLKKPWTVATNHAGIGTALSKLQCKCDQQHAQGRGIALKKTEEYTFKMTDAIHKALTQQQPSLKHSCCALSFRFPRTLPTMLARAIAMARECAVAGRPAVLDRITQWERSMNVFRAAVATATWDDPQVLLRQMDGCRLPIANIVEPTLGGGNAEGAYATLVEVFNNTPDGYLAECPYPPGGEVDCVVHLGLVIGPRAGPECRQGILFFSR